MKLSFLVHAQAHGRSLARAPRPRASGPTLQHFIIRAEMINAYRKAVRATRPLPDSQTRRETLDFLRSDLERIRYESNLTALRSHLSAFNRLVKQFVPGLGLSGLSSDSGFTGARLVGQRSTARHPLL